MIALVTDSNSQITPELVKRYGVTVVPLTVTLDGEELVEGIDVDVDRFYARLTGGVSEVSTAQPSPGRFATAYAAAAVAGATEVLSMHIGSAVSGTLNSAGLAAEAAPLPVRLVDTGTASFGVALCVREAAEALAAGASAAEAAARAEASGARMDDVFTVGALDLARAGGRLAAGADVDSGTTPVLSMATGRMEVVGQAADASQALDLMVRRATDHPHPVRVAVGHADAGCEPLAAALHDRLARAPEVREVLRYRIGPSVGAHTGPGTVGLYCQPLG